MTYEFAGMLYRNSREMHVAIAEEWLSAGGQNTREDMVHDLAIMSDESLVAEVLEGWDFEDGSDEFSRDELGAAFYHIRHCFDEHFPSDSADDSP